MGATQMVAYNTQTGEFLRKIGSTWETTDNLERASGYPKREMQLAVSTMRKRTEGDWMIIRRQDAAKLRMLPTSTPSARPAAAAPAPPEIVSPRKPKVISVRPEGASSDGSAQIVSLLQGLEAAQSSRRVDELSAKLSQCDKAVSDMYHYIEAYRLSAADGYKAYSQLRELLRQRRAIKNEMTLIQKLRAGKMISSAEAQTFATRCWCPECGDE